MPVPTCDQFIEPLLRYLAEHYCDLFEWNKGWGNEWACQTSNCTGLPNCQIKNIEDTRAYACQSFQSGKTCIQALEPDGQMQIRLDDTDKREVKTFYQYVDHTADCEKMDKWQQAWSSTALWVDKGRGSIRHSFKILPTVSLGIPLVKYGNQDAQNAIKGLGALAGLTARYSPFGFYLSLDGFVGTATVSSSDLNRDVYKNPATLIGGLGVGAFDGLLGLSFYWASLRADGLNDASVGSARIVQMNIDLTSSVIGIIQRTNSDKK